MLSSNGEMSTLKSSKLFSGAGSSGQTIGLALPKQIQQGENEFFAFHLLETATLKDDDSVLHAAKK